MALYTYFICIKKLLSKIAEEDRECKRIIKLGQYIFCGSLLCCWKLGWFMEFMYCTYFRRHRSRFQTRRPLHANAIGTSRPGPPMSLSSKPESGLLQSMASNTVMNCAFWTGLWMFYRFFVPLVTTQIIKVDIVYCLG